MKTANANSNPRRMLVALFSSAITVSLLPLISYGDPPTTQNLNPGNIPGGQTPNDKSGIPNQITNRDTNQPALRQKQEINSASPDFPTAMNPASPTTPTPGMPHRMSTTLPTTQATTRPIDPAMDAANASVQKAQSAYDRQRQKVIASLQNNPDYRTAVLTRNQAASKIQIEPTTAPSQSTLNAATAKLDASQIVTQMQEKAIAADPSAKAAKTQLERAIQYRNQLSSATTQP